MKQLHLLVVALSFIVSKQTVWMSYSQVVNGEVVNKSIWGKVIGISKDENGLMVTFKTNRNLILNIRLSKVRYLKTFVSAFLSS